MLQATTATEAATHTAAGVDPFIATLGLIAAVIVVSSLLSGLIERSGVPQVGVLLALGAVLGPAGLALIDPRLDSPVLRAVATISLALVLFTDALSLSLAEIRRHSRLAWLVMGPGTMLTAVIVATAAWWLLELSLPQAAILGAALASTDPVLLRGLMRRPDLPPAARQALRLESGLNDVVLLPVVLVAMVFLAEPAAGATSSLEWAKMALELFVLGPGAGIAVGLLGVSTLDLIRRRIGVRRDYESLYSLGIAFAAFAAAESFHGSGFLAAFAAGFTISVFDVELCDCFHEYGETTAELALLFSFVLLGASLIWQGLLVADGSAWLFALISLLARPAAFLLSLLPSGVDRRSLFYIAWFGPRGLSSLLLVLVPIFVRTPGSEELFPICSLVVLVSVVVHGGSIWRLGRCTPETLQEAQSLPPAPSSEPPPRKERLPVLTPAAESTGERLPERIDILELQRLQNAGEPVVIVDARTIRALEESDEIAAGAVRIAPEQPSAPQAERLQLPRDAWLIVYCA
jgi:NhaP-type Na+/H+ or K+/H+ antiporter